MSYDFRPSIKRFFERNEQESPFAELSRDVAKTYFDLVRNILIVGGLKYLADKTANTYITLVYDVSVGVLAALVWSHIVWWNVRLFVHLPWKKVGAVLDGVLNIILAIGLMVVAMKLIDIAISEIAKAQAK